MNIGIIREGKTPPDSRVPLIPDQCAQLLGELGLDVVVQPSPVRIFTDDEYLALGVPMREDLSDRDLLLGVKEVPIAQLLPEKTYCFFSHTVKKQSHNRDLLRAVLDKHIRLIDYEMMTDEHGRRVIAFGYFAGVVGAHNGLWTYGKRTGLFSLPRLKELHNYREAKTYYAQLQLPAIKIVLTGTGRVGTGAAHVLDDMGIRKVTPREFLDRTFEEAVYTHLDSPDYVARREDGAFDKQDFYRRPEAYQGIFAPYTQVADIFINGIYWDNRAPAFFSREAMAEPDFRIQVIADITCDIAPLSSVPSTLKASTIADPVYGYDPRGASIVPPYQATTIDVMAIDNLPSELPRDASEAFGNMFISRVLPEFLSPSPSDMLERATIARDGRLTPRYSYLEDFVAGSEVVVR